MRTSGSTRKPRWLTNQRIRTIRAALLDFPIGVICFALVYSLRTVVEPTESFGTRLAVAVALAAINVVSLYLFGVYRRIWERTSGHGVTVIVSAVAAAGALALAAVLVINPRPAPLSVVLFGNLLACGAYILVRYRSRLISGLAWRWRAVWRQEFPKADERVLIVGAGESGQTLAMRLQHRFPGHKYHVVGFVDDDIEKQNLFVEGVRILGTRDDIPGIVTEYNVDLIVLAIHNVTGQDFRDILTVCESTSARIKRLPDVFALVNAKQSGEMLRDVQPEDLIGRSIVTRHEAVDLSALYDKVIMVTGAAGSIGSELGRQLTDFRPVRLILLDNNESGLHDLVTELQSRHPKLTLIPALADITMFDTLEPIFAQHKPDIIFHAAAYKHVPMLEYYPHQALRVNIGGTRNLLELAERNQVERFVLISTDKAVNPTSVMGASKRACELLLHAAAAEGRGAKYMTAVRFGNVLGSRGSVVPTFNRQIENGGPVTITHPDMTRYFMSIPEAVNLIIHAACLTESDDIFILKMGEVVKIVELAERMIRLRGLRPYQDIPIHFTGIRPGEKMHEELYYGPEEPKETAHPNMIKLDAWDVNFDASHFRDRLNELLANHREFETTPLAQLRTVIQASPLPDSADVSQRG